MPVLLAFTSSRYYCRIYGSPPECQGMSWGNYLATDTYIKFYVLMGELRAKQRSSESPGLCIKELVKRYCASRVRERNLIFRDTYSSHLISTTFSRFRQHLIEYLHIEFHRALHSQSVSISSERFHPEVYCQRKGHNS